MSDGPRAPAKYEAQVTRLALLTGLPGVAGIAENDSKVIPVSMIPAKIIQ